MEFRIPTSRELAELAKKQQELRDKIANDRINKNLLSPPGKTDLLMDQESNSCSSRVPNSTTDSSVPVIQAVLKPALPLDSSQLQISPQSTASPQNTLRPRGTNKIIVNKNQKGNPILEHLKSVPYEFGEISSDYEVGQTSGVLYLSLKYHRLYPEYIFTRIRDLGARYVLRIVLIVVDIDDPTQALHDMTRTCVYNNFKIVMAYSLEEAAKYLETFKAFEAKPPDAIKERIDGDYMSKASDFFTNIKSVNKTDVVTLLSTFGSIKKVVEASAEELSLCPGFGEQKVKRVRDAFLQPFVSKKKK